MGTGVPVLTDLGSKHQMMTNLLSRAVTRKVMVSPDLVAPSEIEGFSTLVGKGYERFANALPKSLRKEFLLRCIRPNESDYDKLYWAEHGRKAGVYAYDCISKELV